MQGRRHGKAVMTNGFLAFFGVDRSRRMAGQKKAPTGVEAFCGCVAGR